MKFCYLDESGTGDEPIAVMAGVITDASRMRVTKQHWNELLNDLSGMAGRQIIEFHTRDFYPGNGPWRGIDGNTRSAVISAIFDWLEARKHHIVYSAVDKAKFADTFADEEHSAGIDTPWRLMGLHVSLAIQKHMQKEKKNRGHTVLIFDHEHNEQTKFTDLVLDPPDWTDTYYCKGKKQDKLDQIVDVPHFVDSKAVGLIQVADVLTYFLRKHMELQAGHCNPSYEGETERIEGWVNGILRRSIPKSNIYLTKGRCEASDIFYRYAPEVAVT